MNGKRAWISTNGNAIWWIASSGRWVIGTESAIGANLGGLFSDDPFDPDSDCPQQVSKWNVWTGTELVSSTSVLFECFKGNLKFWQTSKAPSKPVDRYSYIHMKPLIGLFMN